MSCDGRVAEQCIPWVIFSQRRVVLQTGRNELPPHAAILRRALSDDAFRAWIYECRLDPIVPNAPGVSTTDDPGEITKFRLIKIYTRHPQPTTQEQIHLFRPLRQFVNHQNMHFRALELKHVVFILTVAEMYFRTVA
jgi:hypothetical protein